MQEFDAVVVGSGFGGSVAALRLAQAGLRVSVIERGRRWPPGSFPRDYGSLDGWLYGRDRGLYDLRLFPEMRVVQGTGWGGGSLVYANVHLRPAPETFAGWPVGYTRAALDPYYDRVASMLRLQPITAAPRQPARVARMREAAAAMGREGAIFHPDLAIDFEKCTFCGECDVGCNVGAKVTLDLSYLMLAEATGRVEALTGHEVISLSPRDGGGWRVQTQDAVGDFAERAAPALFLCCGAVNTTELLLRAKADGLPLPAALGSRYSNNGDVLSGFFGTTGEVLPWDGPTITSALVYDRAEGGSAGFVLVQDGGFPPALAHLDQLFDPRAGGVLLGAGRWLWDELQSGFSQQAAARLGVQDAGARHSAILLAMGRDAGDGLLSLDPSTRQLQIKWNAAGNLPLASTELRLCSDVAAALGGSRLVVDPFWAQLHWPIAVHNLGGCPMGDDAASSVVDPDGQVHGQPGLFVLDGAALPASLGANPSHTIAAVAERNVERFLARTRGEAFIRQAAAPRRDDPLAAARARVGPGASAAPRTPAVGLSFTETLHGALARFTVVVIIDDLDRFLADSEHTAIATGRIDVPGQTPEGGAEIRNGVVNLITPERVMLYALPFQAADGRNLLLDGTKTLSAGQPLRAWEETTTLHAVLRDGWSRQAGALAQGDLVLTPLDFARQLTTFEATGAAGPLGEAQAIERFGRAFLGGLWEIYGRQP